MCTAPAAQSGHNVSLREVATAAYHTAQSVHGDLDLGIEEFSERLIAVLRKCRSPKDDPSSAAQLLGRLHTDDLYLSTACALHRDKAWWRFDSTYRKYMNDLVTYFCSAHSIAREIKDTVAVHLFLPDRSGRSRISSYDGRSSLATWLRVVITNRIINEGQRRCNEFQYDDTRPELQDWSALPLIESGVDVSRYEPLVCAAVRRACGTLSARERELLLWRFDREAPLGRIAREFGVHQSTITRTLDRIAAKLRTNVRLHLNERRLDGAAIDECLSILMDGKCESLSILDSLRAGVAATADRG
jgi:RNA polymerase sigma-70 factor